MGKSIYTHSQIELIRKELAIAYTIANNEENLSWKDLVKSIEEYFSEMSDSDRTERPLPFCNITSVHFAQHDNLRKFANGESKTMDPIKLIAVSYWLMDETRHWSSLTKEKLYGMHPQPKVALLFSDFLHENTDEKPYLSAEMISGDFFRKKNNIEIKLSIYSKITEYVLSVAVHENIYEKNKNDVISSDETSETIYDGWMVIAPNDGLFCILKNQSHKCNHVYIPLALGEGVLEKQPVSHITFLNQSTIDYSGLPNMNENGADFLNRWASNNSKNIIVFQRNKNSLHYGKGNAS